MGGPNSSLRVMGSHLPLAPLILWPALPDHRRADTTETWEMGRCPRSAGSQLLPSPRDLIGQPQEAQLGEIWSACRPWWDPKARRQSQP